MPPRHHILITGTGRAGTTFLTELFTHLGLDTGFSVGDLARKKHKIARAGLEHSMKNSNCPYVVKSPHFCDYANDVLHRDDIVIERVFIPIRDLKAAAESRRYVAKTSAKELPLRQRVKHLFRPKGFVGGLWQTSQPKEQEMILLEKVYKLMLALSDTDIPVTLMHYPRITQDSQYLFSKLKPVLPNIGLEEFRTTFAKVVCPELVHSFNDKDCWCPHVFGQQ
jgi:hypothetical protein